MDEKLGTTGLNMKLVMEIKTLDGGVGRTGKWTRIRGQDTRGRYAQAHAYAGVAESLAHELNKLLVPGEDIGTRGFMIDLVGEWEERAYTDSEGNPKTSRSFKIQTFDILMGPVAELAKIRRHGAEVIKTAETHRREGRLDLAYRTIAEFAASTCGLPLDLSDLEETFREDDEAEFGIAFEGDPEAAAAAHFAAADVTEERMEVAGKVSPSDEEPDATSSTPSQDEQIPMEDDEDRDVLEDAVEVGQATSKDEEPAQASPAEEARQSTVPAAARPVPPVGVRPPAMRGFAPPRRPGM